MTHQADREVEREKRNRKRTRWLLLSTWGTTVTAFLGFFTLWVHLGNTTATASVAPNSSSQTQSNLSNPFSGSEYHHGRHHRDAESGTGFGDSNQYNPNPNGDFQGSVTLNPNQNQGQGSDFSSGAS